MGYHKIYQPGRRKHWPTVPLTPPPASPTIEEYEDCDLCGGVPVSTEMLAVKRHAGVHAPVIECKTIIANQELAYAA